MIRIHCREQAERCLRLASMYDRACGWLDGYDGREPSPRDRGDVGGYEDEWLNGAAAREAEQERAS